MIIDDEEIVKSFGRTRSMCRESKVAGCDVSVLKVAFRRAVGAAVAYGAYSGKSKEQFLRCMEAGWDDLNYIDSEVTQRVPEVRL